MKRMTKQSGLKHLPIRAVGMIAGVFILAFTVNAACNKAGSTVNCYTGSSGDSCSAYDQNCASNQSGTVTDVGTQTTITGVAKEESGQSSSKNNGSCTYVCTISADCKGQSPQEDLTGNGNIVPDGSSCTGT